MTGLVRGVNLGLCGGLLLAAVASVSLSGCNTMEGAGKDIEATGDAISDTARDTKEEMTE